MEVRYKKLQRTEAVGTSGGTSQVSLFFYCHDKNSMITATYKREHLNGGLLIVSEDEFMS